MEIKRPDLSAFQDKCPVCLGIGYLSMDYGECECEACNGSGWVDKQPF